MTNIHKRIADFMSPTKIAVCAFGLTTLSTVAASPMPVDQSQSVNLPPELTISAILAISLWKRKERPKSQSTCQNESPSNDQIMNEKGIPDIVELDPARFNEKSPNTIIHLQFLEFINTHYNIEMMSFGHEVLKRYHETGLGKKKDYSRLWIFYYTCLQARNDGNYSNIDRAIKELERAISSVSDILNIHLLTHDAEHTRLHAQVAELLEKRAYGEISDAQLREKIKRLIE